MPTRAAEILARPLALGSTELPNRIVMAPMTRAFSPGGVPGEDVAAYYQRRAAAGTGLIITEGTYVDDPSAGDLPTVPFFHGDGLTGWGKVASAVHEVGGRIMPQLWHVGITRTPGSEPFPQAPSVGPSGIALDGTEGAGEALSAAGLERIIGAFADAARQAELIGFDGVELHGAHGYLIDEFLWERTNRRSDSYGGGPAERARFAADIVSAVREAVSTDFPIVFRFSQWKAGNYDAKLATTPDELATVLTPLADAGVSAFHASGRRYWEPEFPESGSGLNVAGWTRKLTGTPTITVGSVGLDQAFAPETLGDGTAHVQAQSIERMLDRLEDDEFDLVAVGRALLADPEWAQKVLDGRESELVPFTKDALQNLH